MKLVVLKVVVGTWNCHVNQKANSFGVKDQERCSGGNKPTSLNSPSGKDKCRVDNMRVALSASKFQVFLCLFPVTVNPELGELRLEMNATVISLLCGMHMGPFNKPSLLQSVGSVCISAL